MPKPKQKHKPLSSHGKHLGDRGVVKKSAGLHGQRIALCVCGGIGATEAVKIARETRRHGAEITAFMTADALRFITPLSVQWATGNEVVLEASARVEYLESFDAVVVVPATLHTLSKSALGITDNVVTLLIGTSLAKKQPVYFVPSMNDDLWAHPLFKEYQSRLESWGARFWKLESEEERLKVPDAGRLAEWLMKGG